MHRGFNLTLGPERCALSMLQGKFLDAGRKLFESQRTTVASEIETYTNQKGVIDGGKLQGNWFPEIGADVFVSHSHADTEKALALAGWLNEEFKLSAFVDSAVWRYGDDLIRRIDKRYCYDANTETYRYKQRNKTTAHVHMMLVTALAKMIDRTECLVFLNTPMSATAEDATSTTHSPWLFAELTIAETTRRKPTGRANKYASLGQNFGAGLAEAAQFSYPIDRQLAVLAKLDSDGLSRWRRSLKNDSANRHPLDLLYESTAAKGVER